MNLGIMTNSHGKKMVLIDRAWDRTAGQVCVTIEHWGLRQRLVNGGRIHLLNRTLRSRHDART